MTTNGIKPTAESPVDAAMAVCAIAAGSMMVCHANDSYFWVVVNMGGLKQTLDTLVISLAAMLNVLLVSLIL